MPPIRVLIVDDSVVVRRLLTDVLTGDNEIEVAGTAIDGSTALAKIPLLKPDLVTLDIEMPGISGLETVVEIRKLYPKLPVIMFSTLTERGGAYTLEALALGASDYVTKPSNTGSIDETRARIQQELIPKVKGLCKVGTPLEISAGLAQPSTAPHLFRSPSPAKFTERVRIDIVAIGCSTGGPNALAVLLLPALPKDFPVPIAVVVSYADFITLLFAFFVVLYSSSQIDKRKVARLALAIQVAFQELGVFETSNTKIPLSDTEPVPFAQIQTVENAERTGDRMKGMLTPTPPPANAPLTDIQSALETALAPEIQKRVVDVKLRKEGLIVSLREIGFYESGSATMRNSAMGSVDRLASVLIPAMRQFASKAIPTMCRSIIPASPQTGNCLPPAPPNSPSSSSTAIKWTQCAYRQPAMRNFILWTTTILPTGARTIGASMLLSLIQPCGRKRHSSWRRPLPVRHPNGSQVPSRNSPFARVDSLLQKTKTFSLELWNVACSLLT